MPFELGLGLKNIPAALTPVGRAWHPRRSLAGTYDDKWKSKRFPFLPSDFEWRFNNAAPNRLQMTFEEALSPIRFSGMSAAPFQFELGMGRLIVVQNADDGAQSPLIAPIDTVIVCPATRRVDTVWRVMAPPGWLKAHLIHKLIAPESLYA
jgi:hypothetical protein